jgi:HEPN domain-containing protein
MKPLTLEWVQKAEEDFLGATQLARRRKVPVPNLVCFHCQQCVEKYLKARLQEYEILFPKTHDLPRLLGLLLSSQPLWEHLRDALEVLTEYGVEFRYPGENATVADAKRALVLCRSVRRTARQSLALDDKQRDLCVRESKVTYKVKRRRKHQGAK